MTTKARQVAILLESSTAWGSLALQGIADFVREHEPWSIFVEPRGWYERPRLPPGWKGDGIIGRVTSPRLAREIEATGAPAINLAFIRPRRSRIYTCTSDEVEVGRMAAEHLLSRGLRHFGYCGPARYPHYHDRCGPAFADAVRAAGCDCSMFRQAQSSKAARLFHRQQQRLGRWLRHLPKPAAVFTWNAERGRQVIDVCGSARLRVPEDVAVLGGENDAVMCELCRPPLSGIDQGPRAIGYAAAQLLHRLMNGRRPPEGPVLFKPVGVVTRRSTDVLAVDDPVVVAAAGFIAEHAHESIRVADVVRHVRVSRRMLEQRFVRRLGRSPAKEIRRAHLDRARLLLAQTDLPMSQVAARCGFHFAEVMSRVFRSELGLTPTDYRRSARAPAG